MARNAGGVCLSPDDGAQKTRFPRRPKKKYRRLRPRGGKTRNMRKNKRFSGGKKPPRKLWHRKRERKRGGKPPR